MRPKIKHLVPRGLKNYYHLVSAALAALFYRFPAHKLINIGVTGTDGKTTTAYFVYEILKAAGKKAALVTSIEAKISGRALSTGLHTTTPNPWKLQKFLQQAVWGGAEYAVLEVTSHAIDQQRIFGIPFQVGVLTNITPEHLDYHQTFQDYQGVKRSFLGRCVKQVDLTQVETLSRLKANFPDLSLRLLGDYNYLNALAASGAAKALGIPKTAIYQGVKSLKSVLGRLQVVYEKSFQVMIDFAHTPAALQKVLTAARKFCAGEGRLIVVFGCAGERDREKRPQMGKIASKLADITILTAEDPRSENVNNIIDQIAAGGDKRKIHKIPDRQKAINFAIRSLARPKDVIIICGKGHEQSMCFGKTEHPWSDFEAVQKALAKISKNYV